MYLKHNIKCKACDGPTAFDALGRSLYCTAHLEDTPRECPKKGEAQ
jgi:hypothetical protein